MGSSIREVQRKLDLSLEDLVEEEKTSGGLEVRNRRGRRGHDRPARDRVGQGHEEEAKESRKRPREREAGDHPPSGQKMDRPPPEERLPPRRDVPPPGSFYPPAPHWGPYPPPSAFGPPPPHMYRYPYDLRPPVPCGVHPPHPHFPPPHYPPPDPPRRGPPRPNGEYPPYNEPLPQGHPGASRTSAAPRDEASSSSEPRHARVQRSAPAVSLAPAVQRGFQVRLSNIPSELTARDLAEAFQEVSESRVESVDLLRDKSGKATGEALVVFRSVGDAQNAVRRYHGGDLNGKRLLAVYEGEAKAHRR